jgi:N-methylhydantoinase B
VRKDLRVLADDDVLSNLTDRQVVQPWGLDGGSDGALGATILNPGTDRERKLHSKETVVLARNDLVSFRCSGSGGFGPPSERDPALVREDVREGRVTPRAARTSYGVEVGDER